MIAAAGTIVVKVGSSSLTQPSGHLDPDKLDALAAALAQVRLMGGRVVLVSSGAIAAGFGPLGFDSRPVDVATQQATAAVGQGLLMARYETAFGRFGIDVYKRQAAAVTTVTIVAAMPPTVMRLVTLPATLPPVTPMPAPTRTMMISIPMTLPTLAVPVAPAA